MMRKRPEIKSILKEARGLWKKGILWYPAFSFLMAIISFGAVYLNTNYLIQASIQSIIGKHYIELILGMLCVALLVFPRIGLIVAVDADMRGKRCGAKGIFHAIAIHWPRVLLAAAIYSGVQFMIIVFGYFAYSLAQLYSIPYAAVFPAFAGLLAIWFSIKFLLLPYTAMLSPDEPLLRHTFRVTRGRFWMLLRTNINTFTGWLIVCLGIYLPLAVWLTNYRHMDPPDMIAVTIWYVITIFLIPYRTAAEVILYRRYEAKWREKKTTMSAKPEEAESIEAI